MPTRPAPPVLTEKDLKGFDEILENTDGKDDWVSAQTEIDYNAKLVFSDDEDNTNNNGKDLKSGSKGSNALDSAGRNTETSDKNENYDQRETDWKASDEVLYIDRLS